MEMVTIRWRDNTEEKEHRIYTFEERKINKCYYVMWVLNFIKKVKKLK